MESNIGMRKGYGKDLYVIALRMTVPNLVWWYIGGARLLPLIFACQQLLYCCQDLKRPLNNWPAFGLGKGEPRLSPGAIGRMSDPRGLK